MPEVFSGRVHSIIFENSGGFYVLKVALDGADDFAAPVTAKGNILGLDVKDGTWLSFEGEWVTHEQYGRQITITRAPVMPPRWSPETASSVLSANGVGELIAGVLRDVLGDDMVDMLDANDPEALAKAVPEIADQAAHILRRWMVAKAYFRTLHFLSEAGVPRHRIARVWTVFSDNAEEILSTNPWALVRIDGITFAQADEVARKLGLDPSSPHRIEGATLAVCKAKRGLGHLFLTTGEVFAGVEETLSGIVPQDVGRAIATLHKAGHLVVDRETRPGFAAVYEPWLHFVEEASVELILTRMEQARLRSQDEETERYRQALGRVGPQAEAAFAEDPQDWRELATAALRDWATGSKLTLSARQVDGVVNALIAPVSILTGLPGTGKSTSLRAVVSILQDAGVSFALIAPTGIAAKRITAVTGAPAATIHRAFGAKGGRGEREERQATYTGVVGSAVGPDTSEGTSEAWECMETPHHADVVLIDESSMVDQHLLYRILACTRPTTRLVFIGDAAQLPSVGPGNVLRDLIASKLFPTVSLTEVFRQAETSGIIVAAHAIHRGEVPSVGKDSSNSDFVMVTAKSDEQVVELVSRLAQRLYTERKNFQVLSPRHQGTVGVTNLNARLRELLNPKQAGVQEMRLGPEVIREDDRVMIVRNNYDLDVFNGDVGKVERLDRKARIAQVKLHGPPAALKDIPFKDAADYLRLAYCVTIHKSQGLEYDYIVLPLVTGFHQQLQRNLLYTAITRARKKVILVGHYEALQRAVENSRPDSRNTMFLDRLRIAVEQRRGNDQAPTVEDQPRG